MKKALVWIFLLIGTYTYAQNKTDKCGFAYVKSSLIARDPGFQRHLDRLISSHRMQIALAKTSGPVTFSTTVPVIFHVVIDSAQRHQIGDSAGIAARIISQMQVLNEDYNRGNADSVNIPGPFKPAYDNVHISYALAHTDPNGRPTPGWEIVNTPKQGFDVYATDPCGEAKHFATGGADAWDVSKYINVWIINFTYGGQPSQVLGLTVPRSFTADTITGFPVNEMGVLLCYSAFGRRVSPSEYFYTNIDQGRTLTHEMGHYFGLFHTWGDDNGACPDDFTGQDDGITDTPPEAYPNYTCQTFPHYDACAVLGLSNGIMFNNYMDYTNDACMNMFTHGQAVVMDAEIQPGGESHELTIHPELLKYPGNIIPASDNSFVVTPNPSSGHVYISFNQVPTGFQQVVIRNTVGQVVLSMDVHGQQTSYFPVNISALAKGAYYITCYFADATDTRKIVVL